MKHCSKIIECTISYKVECVHCEALNYVSQPDWDGVDITSGSDFEAITCWSCGKDSLVDEELMLMYPEYPDESVGGLFEGKREP